MSTDSGGLLPPWLCIATWISLGFSMIMFNKIILTNSDFNYPFFLTTWHCVLGTVLTQIMAHGTSLLPAVGQNKVSWGSFWKKLFPISFLTAYCLAVSNIAYSYISLSFIQMIKSLAPVPMLLLSFALGRESPTWLQFVIVLIVSLGVMLSTVGEMRFSLVGFILQLSAVLFECLRLSLMDILLKDIKLDSLSLLYYNAPASAVLIGLGFVVFELDGFPWEKLDAGFCVVLFFNGLLAFSLNLAVIFLIKNTSPVVLSVCGPVRDVLILITSVAMFHTEVTVLQIVGYSTALFGLYLFREYKSDAGLTLRNKLLHARSVLCDNLCFMFNLSSEDSKDYETLSSLEMMEMERSPLVENQ